MPMNPYAVPTRRSLLGWRDLLQRLPADMRPALEAAYAEDGRAYHDAEHPGGMWHSYLVLGGNPHDVAIQLAIAWHDAVYDFTAPPGRNEQRSGDALASACARTSRDFKSADVDDAYRMILATASHLDADGIRERFFCDLDLAGMAIPWAEFADNTRLVRLEYGHLTDAEFAAGRHRFFGQMLQQAPIYRSGEMPAAWEVQAQSNLRKSLSEGGANSNAA